MIEASGDVGVQEPWAGPLLHRGREDRLDRVHRAPPGPEPVAVHLEARLPFWFERALDESLHHAVLDGRNAQGSGFAVRLRDVHPPCGPRPVPAQGQIRVKERLALFRCPTPSTPGVLRPRFCWVTWRIASSFADRERTSSFWRFFTFPKSPSFAARKIRSCSRRTASAATAQSMPDHGGRGRPMVCSVCTV